MRRVEQRFAAAPLGAGPPLYFELNFWPLNPYQAKIEEILARHFSSQDWIDITPETAQVPLMAALVRKRSHSFTEGQKLYVYDGYWGGDENVLVVGRFRRSGRWVRSHCRWENLDEFRPQIVYDPHAIQALARPSTKRKPVVSAYVFRAFLPMPMDDEL